MIPPDLRYAWRSLLRAPGFTLVAALTIALGIGANLAVFSTIDALLLRPLPLDDIDRLVAVVPSAPVRNVERMSVAPADFLDWRQQSQSVERLSAFDWWDVNLTGIGEPERLQGCHASVGFFDVLGVEAAQGRTFAPREGERGQELVAVVSHAFWMRRFGGEPILGHTLNLNGQDHTVIGIAPQTFDFPDRTDVWAPLVLDDDAATMRATHYLDIVVGRLMASASIGDAQSEFDVIASRLEKEYPETNTGETVRVMTFVEAIRDGGAGPFLMVLQATSALVLLIACVNVANMLLARGAGRQKELAVRVAHGASQTRLVRLLLTESLLLSAVSAAAALIVGWVGVILIRTNMPPEIARYIPGWGEIDLDGRLVMMAVAISLACGLLFGALPAWKASGAGVGDTLKEGGRSAAAGSTRGRLRHALVVAEIALALALLVGAALTTQGSLNLLYGSHGYDPTGVLTQRIALPDTRYPTPDARRQFFSDTLARIASLPGVTSASLVSALPSGGNNSTRAFAIDGRPEPPAGQLPTTDYRTISPEYFQTLRIPLVRGRALTDRDDENAPLVGVISQSMADRFWPGETPIGQRIRFGLPLSQEEWLEIVGVVGDVTHHWFDRRSAPTVYRPFRQAPGASMGLAVRTQSDPVSLAGAVRDEVHAVDPNQPVYDVFTMRRLMDLSMVGLSYMAWMMTTFGVLALLLAAVGVYGVMSYSVTQRTHEFGVRIALGAGPSQIVRLVLTRVAGFSSLGILVGLVGAYALSQMIISTLSGVVAMSVATVAVVAVGLTGVAILAGYVPARRTLRVDPVVALRGE